MTLTEKAQGTGNNYKIITLDDLVLRDHLVWNLEAALNWSFTYDMVEGSYSENSGRSSIDPVVLIKLPVIQYMFGLRSMRQTTGSGSKYYISVVSGAGSP